MEENGISSPGMDKVSSFQVVSTDDGHISLVTKDPNKVFMNFESCSDLPVIAICLAGEYRTGKSLALNIFKRHLEHLEAKSRRLAGRQDDADFMDPPPWDQDTGMLDLSTFNCNNNAKGVTIGVWVCRKIYRLHFSTGQDIAVVLIDTQGTYSGDVKNESDFTTKMYALSTMISSIFVLNISNRANSNDTEYFSLFNDVLNAIGNSDFGNLCFLVRDCPYINLWGLPKDQNQCKRDHIYKENINLEEFERHFSQVRCIFLPYPGLHITERYPPDRPIEVSVMRQERPEFVEKVNEFISLLLSNFDTNVLEQMKDANGFISDWSPILEQRVTQSFRNSMTVKNWFTVLQQMVETLSDPNLPKINPLRFLCIEINYTEARRAALEHFVKCMEEVAGKNKKPCTSEELKNQGATFHKKSVLIFEQTPKIYDEGFETNHIQKLKGEISNLMMKYEAVNNIKIFRKEAEVEAYYKMVKDEGSKEFEVKMERLFSDNPVQPETLTSKADSLKQEIVSLFKEPDILLPATDALEKEINKKFLLKYQTQLQWDIANYKKTFQAENNQNIYNLHNKIMLEVASEHHLMKSILIGLGLGLGVSSAATRAALSFFSVSIGGPIGLGVASVMSGVSTVGCLYKYYYKCEESKKELVGERLAAQLEKNGSAI